MNGVTAAILAGGLGTRLRSVVADRPKVLAPVAGRPFVTHLLDRLAEAGCAEVVLLVGFGADQVRGELGAQYSGMRLSYSAEAEPLGTGGAIRHALPHLRTDRVLVMNGDSFADVQLAPMLRFHDEAPRAATLALARVPDAGRFGRVEVGPGGRVVRFAEKAPSAGAGWINAGVYLLPRDVVAGIATGRVASLEREVFPELVDAGRLRGFESPGRFIDIGVPDSYREAERFFAPTPC